MYLFPLSDSQHHHFPLSPSPTTMPSMGAQAAGEGLIGAHRRDRHYPLRFLPLPPFLHSWPKSVSQFLSHTANQRRAIALKRILIKKPAGQRPQMFLLVLPSALGLALACPHCSPGAAAAHRCSLSRKLPSSGLPQSRLAQSHSAHQSTETGGEMLKMWKEVATVAVPMYYLNDLPLVLRNELE